MRTKKNKNGIQLIHFSVEQEKDFFILFYVKCTYNIFGMSVICQQTIAINSRRNDKMSLNLIKII